MVTLAFMLSGCHEYVITNHAPTGLTLSNSSIPEHQPVNTVVGVLTAIDADPADTHTYALDCTTAGVDDGKFNIHSNQLRTGSVLDRATQDIFHICIKADDGNGGKYYKDFTITVLEANGTSPSVARTSPVSAPQIIQNQMMTFIHP